VHAQVPEHTWGVDIKTYLPDYANWTNTEFEGQLAGRAEDYVYTQGAWTRQRAYTRWALQALGTSAAVRAAHLSLTLPHSFPCRPVMPMPCHRHGHASQHARPHARPSWRASQVHEAHCMQGTVTRQGAGTGQMLSCMRWGGLQGLKFWGVLEELEELKRVPDVAAPGWRQLGSSDSLNFSSHAWKITLDAASGPAPTDLRWQPTSMQPPWPLLSVPAAPAPNDWA
jgi:hypothetical protein